MKKFKIGNYFSQSWASFKNGSSVHFDIFELICIDDEDLCFKSISSSEIINTKISDIWKYDLIYLDKKKKLNILNYKDELFRKSTEMEKILVNFKF